jgi:hypothetical protein
MIDKCVLFVETVYAPSLPVFMLIGTLQRLLVYEGFWKEMNFAVRGIFRRKHFAVRGIFE